MARIKLQTNHYLQMHSQNDSEVLQPHQCGHSEN